MISIIVQFCKKKNVIKDRFFPNPGMPETDCCWKTGCEIKILYTETFKTFFGTLTESLCGARQSFHGWHLWMKVINKTWENIFKCPNLPGSQAASNFAATIRRCALRVPGNGACNCCRAFLPLCIFLVLSRRLTSAPTSCAEHYVIARWRCIWWHIWSV